MASALELVPPTVEFFMFYPSARRIEPASKSLQGSLPARALQVCPPVTTASGFGWYVYPPADFALRWDGQCSEWSLLEENEPVRWRSLAGGHDAVLPAFREAAAKAPDARKADFPRTFGPWGGELPFLNADPTTGNLIECTTGILARTSPGWGLLARSVPNWPVGGYQILDGALETDWYHSHIPTMIRLTDPGRIVRFYRNLPLATLQPIPYVAWQPSTMGRMAVIQGFDGVPEDVWSVYVRHREGRIGRSGGYQRRHRHEASLRERRESMPGSEI